MVMAVSPDSQGGKQGFGQAKWLTTATRQSPGSDLPQLSWALSARSLRCKGCPRLQGLFQV